MPGIGLRYRFFFVILTSLILAAIAINVVHANFFRAQRINLIDRQIAESSAQLLQSTEFQKNLKKSSQAIDEVISKVLQGSRIGKLFILRDNEGHIHFQSFNFGLLKIEIPVSPEWVTVETENEYVRVRNVKMTNEKNVTLQVGLVLDRNFINWKIIDGRVIYYVISIVLFLFVTAAFLTLFLLSPLRRLILHLNEATSNLTYQKSIEPLPGRLDQFRKGLWATGDEFASLLHSVHKLIDRINLNYKLTRFWTSQMAHGLKTPLAILRAHTESKDRAGQLPSEFSKGVYKEITQMTGIIDQFLDWAELENSLIQKNLHALRIKTVAQGVAARLEKLNPGRLKLDFQSDFAVVANPVHLDQVITNLVTNALKFSPPDKPVKLIVSENTFSVDDCGPGLPAEVRERLGEPFNIGTGFDEAKSGNGLGLAMVATVAKLYQWEFSISSYSSGTKASVEFPLDLI